jgi:hypothetical protein
MSILSGKVTARKKSNRLARGIHTKYHYTSTLASGKIETSVGKILQNNEIILRYSRKMRSLVYLYTKLISGKMKTHGIDGHFYRNNVSE